MKSGQNMELSFKVIIEGNSDSLNVFVKDKDNDEFFNMR